MGKLTANAKAQRKFMESDDNRLRVYRNRALDRIRAGMKVSVQTLDKFNISEDEYNKIRIAAGFKKIKLYRPDVQSTKAILAKTNRDAYYKKAIEEERRLANEVKTSERQLKDVHATLEREQSNPSSASISKSTVPMRQVTGKLTLNAIRQYFETQIGKKGFGITSFQKIFGRNPNTGTLNTVLRLMKCDPDDIIKCLKDTQRTIKAIEDAKVSAGTKRGYLEGIYTVLQGFPDIQKEYGLTEQAEIYDKRWREYKGIAETETLDRENTDTVDPFSVIKARVLKKYGKDTQERLFIKIYSELPLRDNLGDVIIVARKEDVVIDKADPMDYLLWNEKADGTCEMTLYISSYKTFQLYGTIEHKISDSLCKELAEDILEHPRDFFFIKNNVYNKLKPSDLTVGEEAIYKDGRMSGFVKDMLVRSGTKSSKNKQGGTHNAGSINLLRHSFISEWYKQHPKASAEERAKISMQFRHSPVTSVKYVRDLGIEKLSKAQLKARLKADVNLD